MFYYEDVEQAVKGDGIRWAQVRGGVLAKKRKKRQRMTAAVEAPRLEIVHERPKVLALVDVIVWALCELLNELRRDRR